MLLKKRTSPGLITLLARLKVTRFSVNSFANIEARLI